MAKKMGYSATTTAMSAGKKHSVTAAAAVMTGDKRRMLTPHREGSSTVSMVPVA